MTAFDDNALVNQRQRLRLQLLAQRRQIARKLGDDPERGMAYPRSATMRFILHRPALSLRLLLGLATLLGIRKARRTPTQAISWR